MTIEEALDMVLSVNPEFARLLPEWKKRGFYTPILKGEIKSASGLYQYAPPAMLRFAARDNQQLTAELMPHLDKGAVLEIACGKGYLLAQLAANGFAPLYGLDISPGQIALARKRLSRYDRITLIHARAESVDYTCLEPFSTIIMKNFWGFLPGGQSFQLLDRLGSALEPSGQMVVGPYINVEKDPEMEDAYNLLYEKLGFRLDYTPAYDFSSHGFQVTERLLDNQTFFFLQTVNRGNQ